MNAPYSRPEDDGRGNGMRDQGGRTGGVRKKDTVCKFWVQGRCLKGDKCEYLHEYIEDKVPICSEFLHHGVCKKANCKFRHKLPPPCEWYQRGFCKHGKHKCSGTHTPRKACMAYLLGFCPNGPECPDAQFAKTSLPHSHPVAFTFASSFFSDTHSPKWQEPQMFRVPTQPLQQQQQQPPGIGFTPPSLVPYGRSSVPPRVPFSTGVLPPAAVAHPY